jgi:hypothetical protein
MMVRDLAEREREYRRRLVASTLFVLLAQCPLWLLPAPRHRAPAALFPGEGPFRGLALLDLDLGVGLAGGAPSSTSDHGALAPEPAAVSEAAEVATPSVEEHAAPEPRPVTQGTAPQTAAPAGSPADREAAPPGGPSGGIASGGIGSEDSPGSEVILSQPRIYVAPRMPEQVLRRRIDDFVMLKAKVGADGRVLEVDVLRTIPDCEECTSSAVEAVRRYVYNPPVLAPGESGVWTVPFTLHFYPPGRRRDR